MGLVTFLHQNKSNNGEYYCWPLGISKEGKKPWCSCYCPVQASRGLYHWREAARLTWLPLIHRSPLFLGIQNSGKTSQRYWTDTCEFQSSVPCNATVWSSQVGAVRVTLEVMLCVRHTWVSGYWVELLWIWSKATTVLPCQSVLKDQSQSSPCELPKAFAVLPLEPEWAHSLVETYELKAMVHLIWVAKICYWHFRVGPQQGSSCPVSFESTEWGWVHFKSKGKFYFWSKNGKVWVHTLEHMLYLLGHGQGSFLGFLPVVWGVEFLHSSCSCTVHGAPDHSASYSISAHGPLSWNTGCGHSALETVWSAQYRAYACGTLGASEKEKKKNKKC